MRDPRHLLIQLSACLLFSTSPLFATDASISTPVESTDVSLLPIGEVDDSILLRLKSFLQESLGLSVVCKSPSAILKATPEDQAKALSVLMLPSEKCMLAVMNISEDIGFREGAFPSDRVALLNIRALRSSDLSSDEGKEQFSRRIEKQALFAVASVLGLESCPFPLCVMRIVESEGDLDSKARGFCPPCQEKVDKMLGRIEEMTEDTSEAIAEQP